MDVVTPRYALGAAGAALAATSGAPALADTLAPEPMQDPKTKYPRPPFERQEQPWPGLASKMNPVPDHGETSYRGSGRLRGRKALITRGDSGMAATQPSPDFLSLRSSLVHALFSFGGLSPLFIGQLAWSIDRQAARAASIVVFTPAE